MSDQVYPFEGIRVLDFGIGAAGVEAGRFFSEWGADVIKVESIVQLDFLRITVGSMMNPLFASSSRTKRSLGVNVRAPEGLALVHRLVEQSDVLIENSRKGAMKRIGLGWETLHEINPRLVMLSSQLLGSNGPWSDWAGYGPNVGAVAGLTYLWNHPEDGSPPVGVSTIYPDHLIGRLLALGGTAALIGREKSGVGAHVEVAQFEAVIGMMGDLLLAESIEPGSAQPQGNVRDRGVPWGLYPSSGDDEWLAITVRDDDQWQRLVHQLGDPLWADTDLDNVVGRLRRREEIDNELAKWTSQRSAEMSMHVLQRAGVPSALIQTAQDQLKDPQMNHRGFPRPMDQPGVGALLLEGPAFRGNGLPEPIIRAAPDLGEHTREICRDLLQLSDEQIEELLSRGVLEESATQDATSTA